MFWNNFIFDVTRERLSDLHAPKILYDLKSNRALVNLVTEVIQTVLFAYANTSNETVCKIRNGLVSLLLAVIKIERGIVSPRNALFANREHIEKIRQAATSADT